MTDEKNRLLLRVRALVVFFMVALLASGLTAFPIRLEIEVLNALFGPGTFMEEWWPAMTQWISALHAGITMVSEQYPFLHYGTDWLAFAHIVIAVLFIGPLRDPVRNIWVIDFGIIACVLVAPTALICGYIRGIPLFWRFIDCSFGVFGIIPLLVVRKWTGSLSK